MQRTHEGAHPIGSARTPRVPVPTRVVAGRVIVEIDGISVPLHPQWLRERSSEKGAVDASNGQRLYEPTDVAADLHVVDGRTYGDDLDLIFSDGHRCRLSIDALAVACGTRRDHEAPPRPTAWRAGDLEMVEARWVDLDHHDAMLRVMQGFFETGCFVLRGTPAVPGALIDIAGRFGRVSATSFGTLFDVRSTPNPDDLAYTALALSAHTDQPYRTPTPGLQFLH